MAAASSSPPGFKLVYNASGMTPVRMLHIVAMAFAVGGTGLALLLLQAPHQQSISHNSKLGWAALLFGLAFAAPIIAWLHGRNIVSKLWVREDGAVLRVEEPTYFGSTTRELARSSLRLLGSIPGDAQGEKALAPSRLQVEVQGGRNFVVILDGRAAQQRAAVLEALRG
jgi:hypothetical protein